MVSQQTLNRTCEQALLALLAFAILWKGGKALESTWLLTGVVAVCVLVQSFGRSRISDCRFQDRKLSFVVLFFIVWTGLSYLSSKTANYGLEEVLRGGALGLLLLWYLCRERGIGNEEQGTSHFEEQFLTWLTRITIASCVIGVVIYLLQPISRFVGTFFDWRFHTDYWPNAFAEFLLLTWPIVLLTHLSRPFSRRTILMGFVLGCLFLTFSRGALLTFLGQILLLLLLLLPRREMGGSAWKPLITLTMSLLVGAAFFLMLNTARSSFHPVQPLTEKLTFHAPEGTSSISERWSFWQQSFSLLLTHPLVGWGPYSFRFVQPRLQTDVLATSDHPHNVFLKLGMEQGIMAAFLFGIITISALLSGVLLSLSRERFPTSDPRRLGYPLLTIALAGVLAHNLIDYNLQFVGIALPFWIVMGMLLHGARMKNGELLMKHDGEKRFQYSPFFILHSFIAFALLSLALREGYYLVTSSLGRRAEAREERGAALYWYERSEGEWFSRDLRLSQAQLLLAEREPKQAEETVHAYLKENSEDARAWKLLGRTLTAEERNEEAIPALERAFALGSWNDLSISRELLEALLAETYRQATSAEAAASQGLPLHPRIAEVLPTIEERVLAFAQAITKNTHFVALSPNPEEAVKILILLSILQPEKVEEYQALITQIDAKAEAERLKLRSRPPGWLW